MKIVILTGIFPPDAGGPATYIPILAEALIKKNHFIQVITLSENTQWQNNFPYELLRIKRKQNRITRLIKVISNIIKIGKRYDVILANGLHLEAVMANMILKKPLVHKFVGDYAWEKARNCHWTNLDFEEFQINNKGNIKTQFAKIIRNFYAKRANCIIVPSNYLKRIVSQWGVAESKIFVVYNAIPDIELDNTHHAKITKTKYSIIYAGRLVQWKNIDCLIRLIKDIQQLSLIIIGEGKEKDNLMKLVKELNIEDKIYFLGRKDKKEMYEIIKQSDIFILFSSYEGFPHILLEAMKIGIPIITTNTGGNPELAKDKLNCLMVEKNNYQQLKDSVKILLSNTNLRNKIIMNARETVKEFTVDKMLEQTEEVLKIAAKSIK